MLFTCPRCTQMLPMDAAFCRRCGSSVQFSRPQVPPSFRKNNSVLTPVLVVLLVGGLALAGLTALRVQSMPSAAPASVLDQQPYGNNYSLSQANRAQIYSQPPIFIPAQRIPMYSVQPPIQYRGLHPQNRQ